MGLHPLQYLKVRCVDAAFNQAEKIDADANEFRKLFLRQLAGKPDCLEPISRVSPKLQTQHLGVEKADH